MSPRSVLLALVLVLSLLATVALAQTRDRRTAVDTGYTPATLSVNGVERRYLVRRPAGEKPPTAIVLLLHGGGGSAERLTGAAGNAAPYRAWNAIADHEGLLLVAPQGADGAKGKPGWNDCRPLEDTGESADDVAFLSALVDTLRREHRVRTPRTFAVGTSNGGMMAMRLAIERPQTFTAIASVVSSMPARSECAAPTRAVPVLMINGTDDALVPWAGGPIAAQFGGRGEALPVETSIRIWSRLANGDASPRTIDLPDAAPDDGTRAQRQIFAVRDGRPLVELIRIDGGGHVEPSRSQRYARFVARMLGRQSAELETADEVWRFFAAQ
jgi:polyhydroxybutyrate depolymerase